MSFAAAFAHTVGVEGGYSNDPADHGGETMWGITERNARAFHYDGDMHAMPLAVAQSYYQAKVWDALGLGLVDAISPEIAAELFDTAVNCGNSVPVPFLRRALNAFNRQGKDWPDVATDGLCDQPVMAALKACMAKRGAGNIIKALNCQQGVRYLDIVRANPSQEAFVNGWFSNRVTL